jgi:hypothetical protein
MRRNWWQGFNRTTTSKQLTFLNDTGRRRRREGETFWVTRENNTQNTDNTTTRDTAHARARMRERIVDGNEMEIHPHQSGREGEVGETLNQPMVPTR